MFPGASSPLLSSEISSNSRSGLISASDVACMSSMPGNAWPLVLYLLGEIDMDGDVDAEARETPESLVHVRVRAPSSYENNIWALPRHLLGEMEIDGDVKGE